MMNKNQATELFTVKEHKPIQIMLEQKSISKTMEQKKTIFICITPAKKGLILEIIKYF